MSSDDHSWLGPYRIEKPIGAGGMGAVYRARDTRLNRDVAIKICGDKFGPRFEREAPDPESLSTDVAIKVFQDAIDESLCLIVVDGFDSFQDSHRCGVLEPGLNQSPRVLGKAAAAISDSGKKECVTDSFVCGKALSHHVDIGAHCLAQV